MYSMATNLKYCIVYLQVAKRVDLKSCYKKNLCMVPDTN